MQSTQSTTTLITDTPNRDSFSDRLWKQLSIRKKKSTSKSFVSYCPDEDTSETGESYISQPSNFQRCEPRRESFTLEQNTIQECPFNVSGYGKLLKKDKFKLKKPKKKKLTVFLFEKIIVLTTEHKGTDGYYYYASIRISNLSLAPLARNKKKILLKDFTNSKLSKLDIEYKLEAKTEEIQDIWRKIIENCLWSQLCSAKGLYKYDCEY